MHQALSRIVIGVGQTDDIDPHLPPALRIAEAQGAILHVVHAYRLPDPLLYPYPEMGTFSPEVTRASQQAVQARLEDMVGRAGRGGRVESRTVPAPADAAIVGTAEEVGADLIIVGATERGAVSRTVLGTTAGRVLRTSKIPVLVNRRPDPAPLRRILMTTDLSDLSGRIYRRGIGLALALTGDGDVEVRTLLVVGDDLATPPPARQSVLREIAEKELRPFLRAAAPDVESSGIVRLGEPATEIVQEADDWKADLLVVGTHGRGGLSRFLIGSVAESIVRKASCDVLVVPAVAVASEAEREASA